MLKMPKTVVIIGAGGHAKVIADIVLCSGDNLIGFLDDDDSKQGLEIFKTYIDNNYERTILNGVEFRLKKLNSGNHYVKFVYNGTDIYKNDEVIDPIILTYKIMLLNISEYCKQVFALNKISTENIKYHLYR